MMFTHSLLDFQVEKAATEIESLQSVIYKSTVELRCFRCQCLFSPEQFIEHIGMASQVSCSPSISEDDFQSLKPAQHLPQIPSLESVCVNKVQEIAPQNNSSKQSYEISIMDGMGTHKTLNRTLFQLLGVVTFIMADGSCKENDIYKTAV
jgi:hypothetical protein